MIKAKVKAWITNHHIRLDSLESLSPEEAVSSLTYYSNDMTPHGWIEVGEADISIRLDSYESYNLRKVEALKAQRSEVLAQADKLEQQIQDLLCLPAPIMNDDNPF